jgi:hypothetical protein
VVRKSLGADGKAAAATVAAVASVVTELAKGVRAAGHASASRK